MRIKLPAAVLLLAAAAACRPQTKAATAASAAPTEKRAMTTMEWKGSQGGPQEPGSQVVSDGKAWEALWRGLGKDAPALDFDAFVAVAAFVGSKPTGGFTAVFDEPVAKGDDLVVRYKIPKPGGFSTQVFTAAWRVRAFPRPKGRVIVEASAE